MEHELLDLKVMRLTPPAQVLTSGCTSVVAAFDQNFKIPKRFLDLGCAIEQVRAREMLLPTSLTKVLVGETFVAYIHVVNVCPQDVSHVSVAAELACSGTRLPPVEIYRSGAPTVLRSGTFLDAVVSQTLQERGIHTVCCTVRYNVNGEFRTLRYILSFNFLNLNRVLQT